MSTQTVVPELANYPITQLPNTQHLTPAFSLTDVAYHYPDGHAALNGISLEIGRGERVAMLGANGSGKSTLLKLINGLIQPTAGRFEAYGEVLDARALRDAATNYRFRQRVGFVFQNADSQLFCPTVREEIAFGPLQLDLPRAEVQVRIGDVAALLGIEPLLDRPPYRLSVGEKKKVAIAAVLVTSPDAILFDEPTAGLDPRSQRWLIDLLAKLHRAGKTLVIATHDLAAAREMADRAIVLTEAHTVERTGPIEDILHDQELLLQVNLIHEHSHWHGNLQHSHPHFHDADHQHEH